MSTKELLEQNKEFLDEVAIKAVQGQLANHIPENSNECVKMVRRAYIIAMAVLSIKTDELTKIAKKEKFFHEQRLKNQK